jgi:hypothetical protein
MGSGDEFDEERDKIKVRIKKNRVFFGHNFKIPISPCVLVNIRTVKITHSKIYAVYILWFIHD